MFKKISLLFLATVLLALTHHSFGQELLNEVPKTKNEFIESESKVLATINWLETSPIGEEEQKRKQQNALLIQWITNSPTVTMEINADLLKFTNKNPDLLIIFMGGWTRYALQNNYSKDNIQGTLAGIRAAIKVYKNQSLKKDKEMEKLIESEEKGELENWVTEKLKKK